MNHNEYSKRILKELSAKYNKEFEIVQITYEVSGDSGNYYRAVCKEQNNANTFIAYYYMNGTDFLLSEELGETPNNAENQPLLVDEYCDLLIDEQMTKHLLDINADVLYTISVLDPVNHVFTVEDTENGLIHCFANYDINGELYLFLNNAVDEKSRTEKQIIENLIEINMNVVNINFVYIDSNDKAEISKKYNNDVYSMERRLREDDMVTRYSWYTFNRNEGIISSKDVKGV